jgi:hypothetical protein
VTNITPQTDVYKEGQTDGRMDLVTTSGLSFLLRTIKLKILKVRRHCHQGSQLIKKSLDRKINLSDILTLSAYYS